MQKINRCPPTQQNHPKAIRMRTAIPPDHDKTNRQNQLTALIRTSQERLGPATKRQLSEELVSIEGMSVSGACKLIGLPRS